MTEVVAVLIWDKERFMICQRRPTKLKAFCESSWVARWSQAKPNSMPSSGSVWRNWQSHWKWTTYAWM